MNNSISIIIPIFNGWNYCSKCLKSLESQIVLPDEIIFIDDFSTDDSYDRLLEYANGSQLKIKVFRNDKNVGPGQSRANGLIHIESDYVAFCDADDWYELSFVRDIKRILCDDNNIDLVIFDNYDIVGGEKVKRNVTKSFMPFDKKAALALYPMSLCRFVVSANLVKSVYFPPLYNGEDGAVAPQIIAKSTNTLVLNEAYYNYFFRENSASFTPNVRIFYNMLDAFQVVDYNLSDEYMAEKEYLGIKMVCYGATLNAFKIGISNIEIKKTLREFNKKYPKWKRNKYFKYLRHTKRVYLFFLRNNVFFIAKAISKIHNRISMRRK